MNKYLSIITLHVNGLNAPIKRHKIAEWIRKHDTHICCLQESSDKASSGLLSRNTSQKERQEIFQVMKGKGLQPRPHYPAKLSFKMEGEIRSFPGKRRLKEYTSTKPALQDKLKGLI